MYRKLLAIVLLSMWAITCACADDSVPLCPDPSSPDCVVSNWGLIEPGIMAAAMAPVATPPVAVKLMPVATSTSKANPPLKALVSPTGLFVNETKALTSAIRKARFNADGTIASGEAQIAAAAADIARKAGKKYALTLYIKVPQKIASDKSESLDKRVGAVNSVLSRSSDQGKS
ncbi:MAG: hypothetical protein ABI277_16500 [Burkholderiaceae bacterium]